MLLCLSRRNVGSFDGAEEAGGVGSEVLDGVGAVEGQASSGVVEVGVEPADEELEDADEFGGIASGEDGGGVLLGGDATGGAVGVRAEDFDDVVGEVFGCDRRSPMVTMTARSPQRSRMSQAWSGGRPRELAEP